MVAVAAWCVFAVRGLVAESTACQVQIPVPRTFEVLFRSLPLQRVACLLARSDETCQVLGLPRKDNSITELHVMSE